MRKGVLIIASVLLLMGCGGGNKSPTSDTGTTTDPTPTPTPTPVVVPAPDKVGLIAPAQNSVCITGTIISATQSSVDISWGTSANTDSYDLNITNLLTAATTTQNLTATQATVTLLRNTPYSWSITSKSTKTSTTTQSDVWRFYNAGPGTVAYAPFPADIVSPTDGQNVTATAGTINLSWQGNSVNTNSITGYDIYFGTTSTPALLKSSVTDSFLNNIPVTGNTVYYWRVVTKDIIGNSSDSGVYQFKVN